jgi:hypothetical protein
MNMRTREEIQHEFSRATTGSAMDGMTLIAILEVLLDIRDLLSDGPKDRLT